LDRLFFFFRGGGVPNTSQQSPAVETSSEQIDLAAMCSGSHTLRTD
jgi:hypothetical protein